MNDNEARNIVTALVAISNSMIEINKHLSAIEKNLAA